MYQLSNLCNDAQRFVSYLAYGDRTRSLLTSLAIGKTLANTANLPSAPIEDIESFYKASIQIPLRTRLSALNELVVIDCDTVLDYARRFYLVRYHTAFPSRKVYCMVPETALEDFMGLTLALAPEAVQAIKANPVELTKLHNSLTDLFEELGN